MNYVVLMLITAVVILFPVQWLTRIKIQTGKAEEQSQEQTRTAYYAHERDDRERRRPITIGWGAVVKAIIMILAIFVFTYFMFPTPSAILSVIVLKLMMTAIEMVWVGDASDWQMRFKALLLLGLFVLPAVLGVAYDENQRVANAAYVNGMISTKTGFPFSKMIPDNMVRLVTEELAASMARQRMSEFGSNREIKSTHITLYNGRLVWVNAIGSTNVFSENYIAGFIIIDANDPTAEPITVHTNFVKGERLWWDHTIQFGAYLADTDYDYGQAYLTPDASGTWKYVLTKQYIGFDLVNVASPPIAVDATGTTTDQFANFQTVPAWVTQPYSEMWMEYMINQWGQFRRGSGFDYWAGGVPFLAVPSRDRVEISEDTRFIVNPDTSELVALIAVHPTTSDQTLAGMFMVNHSGMTFYDFHGQDFISGTRAQAIAAQGLSTTTGTYITEMPLPYSMGAAGSAWLVPIYWTSALRDKDGNLNIGTSDTLTLAGVRLINALDVSKVASVFVDEGYTGAALVREVRNRYEIICCGVPTSSEQVTLTANATGVSSYTVGGQTHFVIRTDNDKYPYLEATPSTLPSDQWQMLLFIKVGDRFTATIQQVGSAWTITSIKLV